MHLFSKVPSGFKILCFHKLLGKRINQQLISKSFGKLSRFEKLRLPEQGYLLHTLTAQRDGRELALRYLNGGLSKANLLFGPRPAAVLPNSARRTPVLLAPHATGSFEKRPLSLSYSPVPSEVRTRENREQGLPVRSSDEGRSP